MHWWLTLTPIVATVVPSAFLPYYVRQSIAPTDSVRFAVAGPVALEALLHDRALYLLSHATLGETG